MSVSQRPASVPAVAAATAVARHGDAGVNAWQRLLSHLRRLFWLKVIGTTAFMSLFFVGYFHVLRHPVYPTVEMPLTVVDGWIGFAPWALWPYVSLWVYVALPPSLLPNVRVLIGYGLWIGALCIAGLVCFYLWPTAVPRVDLNTTHVGFDLLRGVDAAGNACPSLHVATATFSALWLDRLLRELMLPRALRVGNAVWFVLIVWSTMAVKQHVWWDVVGGLALALVLAWPSLRWFAARRRGDIIAA
jgi:membrane-associated phospholipid phosphatase